MTEGLIAAELADVSKRLQEKGNATEQMNVMELTIDAPFQMRRRGVELKLHLGEAPAEIDRTLVQNIMEGRSWLAMVIAGKAFSEIAETEGVSKRRVQEVTNLHCLCPMFLTASPQVDSPMTSPRTT
ncbi:hypothetical protein ACXYMP_09985 [Aliiroseovarius sp. CAU 1755]